MTGYLSLFVTEAAKNHARALYPEESVGLAYANEYLPLVNVAADPAQHEQGDRNCRCRLCSFRIDNKLYAKLLIERGKPLAILHSHPGGPLFPSAADMQGQLQTAVPWGIIPLIMEEDDQRIGEPVMWGDGLPIPPLIGREFMHGVTDCLSLIRHTFILGRDKCLEQDVDWPLAPIPFADPPRNDEWWADGEDLYARNFRAWGFVEVSRADVRPGDVFLMKIHSDQLNHGGLLLNDELILHHLPKRLSGRVPAGMWGRAADMWVRYQGLPDAA